LGGFFLHKLDLLFRQVIQRINQPVNLPVRRFDLALEGGFEVGYVYSIPRMPW
jgi:hypothetical protein